MTNPETAPSHGEQSPSGRDDERLAFGRAVKRLREVRGMTIEAAADKGQITRKTWGRIEAGHPARGLSIRGIERAFDLAPGSLSITHEGRSPTERLHELAGQQRVTRAPHRRPPEAMEALSPRALRNRDVDTGRSTRRRLDEITPEWDFEDGFAEYQLKNLLNEVLSALSHFSTNELVQLQTSVNAALSLRVQQLDQKVGIFQMEVDRVAHHEHDAYMMYATARAHWENLNDAVSHASEEDKRSLAAALQEAAHRVATSEAEVDRVRQERDLKSWKLAQAVQERSQLRLAITNLRTQEDR